MRLSAALAPAVAVGLLLVSISNCTSPDDPTGARSVDGDAALAGADPVVVAAGDLVCGTRTDTGDPCRHAETAELVTSIDPTAVLLLGDIQYEKGTLSDFKAYFDPTWGRHKAITRPVPGNHEYETAGAAGYFDYFNGVGDQTGRAGQRGKGYYSFDLGAWHVVALNSNCGAVGGCDAGSPQEQWLRADLAAHPRTCTLAYWHHPRFSSGMHGNTSSMQPIWRALQDHGADLVLAGHDHDYERFAPQLAGGALNTSRGIRSFVVGVGGKETRAFGVIRANSEVRSNRALGVLKLTLRNAGYDWEFVPIPAHSFTDGGSAQCVGASSPPPPSEPPTGATLTVTSTEDAHVVERSPDSQYGTLKRVLVDGSPTTRSYFKFQVTGVGTRSVVSARLRLYAVDGSSSGGRLHRVDTDSWSESTIRWSNAPSYDSAVIGSLGSVAAGAWYEIDVTEEVTGDGTVSLALESGSSNGAGYRARETGTKWAPTLVIVVQ